MHQLQTAFENIMGKEEIAHNEQFLLFPQCFLLNQKKIISPFVSIFDIISLYAAELEDPQNWHMGQRVKELYTCNCTYLVIKLELGYRFITQFFTKLLEQ